MLVLWGPPTSSPFLLGFAFFDHWQDNKQPQTILTTCCQNQQNGSNKHQKHLDANPSPIWRSMFRYSFSSMSNFCSMGPLFGRSHMYLPPNLQSSTIYQPQKIFRSLVWVICTRCTEWFLFLAISGPSIVPLSRETFLLGNHRFQALKNNMPVPAKFAKHIAPGSRTEPFLSNRIWEKRAHTHTQFFDKNVSDRIPHSGQFEP